MEDLKQKEKIKKILFNEVTAVLAVIGIVVGFMNWFESPQKKIEDHINNIDTNQQLIQKDIFLIQENHLRHIETIQTNIQNLQKERNEDKETVIKLMTIIEERLPSKK